MWQTARRAAGARARPVQLRERKQRLRRITAPYLRIQLILGARPVLQSLKYKVDLVGRRAVRLEATACLSFAFSASALHK